MCQNQCDQIWRFFSQNSSISKTEGLTRKSSIVTTKREKLQFFKAIWSQGSFANPTTAHLEVFQLHCPDGVVCERLLPLQLNLEWAERDRVPGVLGPVHVALALEKTRQQIEQNVLKI